MADTIVWDKASDSSVPTCFVSYSWDSEDHKAWVRRLAIALRRQRVNARLDQWELQPGMDVTQYVEERIRSSDYVVLVCTPKFAEKANSGLGGVGYEKGVITGEIFHGAQATKFVPVLRVGDPRESLPSYLKNKLFVDFRHDPNFDAGINAIVRHIYQTPESEIPPLGTPGIVQLTEVSGSHRFQEAISFSSLMDYARRNYPDLDVTPNHIDEIAGNLRRLAYNTVEELDMAIRPVRHIARDVECPACQRYSCDQITIALALANPEYWDLLGPHQAEHAEWLRASRPRLRPSREGWL